MKEDEIGRPDATAVFGNSISCWVLGDKNDMIVMSVIMDFHHLGEGVCIWQWNKNLSLNSLTISDFICHFVNHTSNNLGLVGDRNEFLVFGSSVALYCISESNELPCLSGGWLSWLGEATSKKKGFFHIVVW